MNNPLQAKKSFHDWLDKTRPWAQTSFKENVYPAMEDIAEHAAMYFAGELPKSVMKDRLKQYEDHLMKFTKELSEHPEGYDGPCQCGEGSTNT